MNQKLYNNAPKAYPLRSGGEQSGDRDTRAVVILLLAVPLLALSFSCSDSSNTTDTDPPDIAPSDPNPAITNPNPAPTNPNPAPTNPNPAPTPDTARSSDPDLTEDCPRRLPTSCILTVEQRQNGDFHSGSDRDLYKITLTPGHRYTFEIIPKTPHSVRFINSYLYHPSDLGYPVAYMTSWEDSFEYTPHPDKGTSYYYLAEADTLRRGYHIFVYERGPDPCFSDYICDQRVGVEGRGAFQSSVDEDWYGITLEEGRIYEIQVTPDIPDMSPDRNLYIWSSLYKGSEVARGYGRTAEYSYLVPIGSGGNYRILASTTTVLSSSQVEYSILVRDMGVPADLEVGREESASFAKALDSHWYYIALLPGKLYEFKFTAGGSNRFSSQLFPPISRSSIDPLATGGYSTSPDFSHLVAEGGGGDYILQLNGTERGGSYTILVTELGGLTELTVGETESFSFASSGEVDWYQFDLAAKHVYDIQINPASSGGPSNIDGFLYLSTNLRYLIGDSSRLANVDLSYIVPSNSAGNYYLKAEAVSGTGDYEVTVQDRGIPTAIVLDHEVSSSFATEQESNWYRIDLSADHNYRIQITPSAGGPSSIEARLYGSPKINSFVLGDTAANVDLFYSVPSVAVPSDASRRYHLKTIADSGSGAYNIRVNEIGSPTELTVGQAVSASFNTEKEELWYQFSVVKDKSYCFEAVSTDSNLSDIDAYLYYAASGQVASDTSAGDVRFQYTIPSNRTKNHYLRVVASSGSGAYDLLLFDCDDMPKLTLGRASSADISGPVLEVFDIDAHRVYLTAGTKYRIEVELVSGNLTEISSKLYRLTTPPLQPSLSHESDANNIDFEYTIPAGKSGTHVIQIFSNSAGNGDYRIKVSAL